MLQLGATNKIIILNFEFFSPKFLYDNLNNTCEIEIIMLITCKALQEGRQDQSQDNLQISLRSVNYITESASEPGGAHRWAEFVLPYLMG